MKSTLAAGGVWLGLQPSLRALAPSEKLNIAVIGAGGQGKANLNASGKENVVAICDVDESRAGDAFDKHPKAKKFHDFRKMFDSMEKEIDAVAISTPDHTHFHTAFWAMQRGKHVYLEKPLAHEVWEVRKLTQLAKEKKLATQLGAQRHTMTGLRQSVEIVRAGVIGEVSEVHSWIGGDRGMSAIPKDKPAVPSHVKWDLWLGPNADFNFHPSICPYGWRFWWQFGTGETGNWGCHILDIPFWALNLKYPTRVEASGPEVHGLTTPKSMNTSFLFPAEGSRGPVTLHWYHAKNGPPILEKHGLKAGGFNNLFIGSKGMLLCGFNSWKLLPEDKFQGVKAPKTFADSPGFHQEWFDAIRGGKTATCNFDYSGPMTETVLLGNVAYRAGGFAWDSANLQCQGNPKAQALIQRQYRKGWEIS
ncbi:MAG: Gfo/Idh/MocA family oxidoreductase [Gemmataceae bacterium]|nr:Gfo/Idh/MocA family oxidoreductase [Gemmataceae bacterium]